MKCKFANQIAINLLACKCNNNYPQSHFKYQTNNNKMGNVETFGEKHIYTIRKVVESNNICKQILFTKQHTKSRDEREKRPIEVNNYMRR